ncbi:hypothetical protein [Aeromonas veronii]|uniref:hypothetical protein n=1 Tax=Aeromonas veronii TaxID=654 RepID=UPI0035B70560
MLIEKVQIWYQTISKKAVYFMLAILASYLLAFISIIMQLPDEIYLSAMALTLIIPFSMLVMLATDNPLYDVIRSKKWLQVTLGLIITIYSTFSLIWASSNVNEIFSVAPSNLPWSISFLTVVYFLKNIVLNSALIALFLLVIYAPIWVSKALFSNYRGVFGLIADSATGIIIVIGVGLIIGATSTISREKEDLVKRFALFADFSTKHNCKGKEFIDTPGVLFLPTGNVLIAKNTSSHRGKSIEFSEVKCEQ